MKYSISRTIKAFVLAFAIIAGSMAQTACGKDSIEKSIGTFVRSVKVAREVSTFQHDQKYLSDEEYSARLRAFKNVYISADKLGDKIVEFGEINAANKIEVIAYIKEVNKAIGELIETGNLGVKNETTRAKFYAALFTANATLSSIQVVVAAVQKPINTEEVKVAPVEENK